MKRGFLSLLAVAVLGTAVNAQTVVSKKGENYLPEAGDHAVGFDAVPFFNALKINDNSDKIFAGSIDNNFTIFGKAFHSANEACRFSLGLGLNTQNIKTDVPELDDNGMENGNFVENEQISRNTRIGISAGKEYRRGNTRVQGLWGAEAFALISSSSDEFTYGNDRGVLGNGTVLESREGTSFDIGVRAFVGAEFFIAPKLSLGVEYGIGLGLMTQAKGETTALIADEDGDLFEQTMDTGSKSTAFGLNTDVTSGAVKLMFHF